MRVLKAHNDSSRANEPFFYFWCHWPQLERTNVLHVCDVRPSALHAFFSLQQRHARSHTCCLPAHGLPLKINHLVVVIHALPITACKPSYWLVTLLTRRKMHFSRSRRSSSKGALRRLSVLELYRASIYCVFLSRHQRYK